MINDIDTFITRPNVHSLLVALKNAITKQDRFSVSVIVTRLKEQHNITLEEDQIIQ